METPWAPAGAPAIGAQPVVARDGSGMLVTRMAIQADARAGEKSWVWSDATGAPIAAITQRHGPGTSCTLIPEDVDASQAVWTSRDAEADALVVWRRDAPAPEVVTREPSGTRSRWSLAPDGYFAATTPARTGALLVADGRTTIHEPSRDPDGLVIAGLKPTRLKDTLVFEVGSLGHRALMQSTANGVQPLRRFPADARRSAGNFGTDGRTMVWSEGTATDRRGLFDTWIFEARATDDPSRLHARAIARDPNPAIGNAPFFVACGRAAHDAAGGPALVDLDSGVVTRVALPSGLRFANVVGLDCDHLTAIAYRGALPVQVRVRTFEPNTEDAR